MKNGEIPMEFTKDGGVFLPLLEPPFFLPGCNLQLTGSLFKAIPVYRVPAV